MVETEQLVLEGVQEQEAYQRYQAALDERRFEYRTDFAIVDADSPDREMFFAMDPYYGPRIYFPDENGSSQLFRDSEGFVKEAIDDDDIFLHRTPKVDEIERFTKRLVDSVPKVTETGVVERINSLFDAVEAKLAAVADPQKSLVARYDDDSGMTRNVNIKVTDNSYIGDRRLTITSFDGDISTELTIARRLEGRLSIEAANYECGGGNEYYFVGKNGILLTHADVETLEHVVYCSQVHVPNVLQKAAIGSQSLGGRVLAYLFDR